MMYKVARSVSRAHVVQTKSTDCEQTGLIRNLEKRFVGSAMDAIILPWIMHSHLSLQSLHGYMSIRLVEVLLAVGGTAVKDIKA